MAEDFKVLVVGAGAVGGFYGAVLARAGARVSLVCRSDYEVVRERGLEVHSKLGRLDFRPESVHRRAEEHGPGADLVLAAYKQLPGLESGAPLEGAVGPDTPILLIQNGIEIEEPLARRYPESPLLSALAFVCIRRPAPGVVEHMDFGRLALGCWPPGPLSPLARRVIGLFEKGGLTVTPSEDIASDRWRKLVWNAPYNNMSVLTGLANTREMMEDKECAALAEAVMREVVELAAAAGRPLGEEVVEQNLEHTLRMEPYLPSMGQDFAAGRALEVEAILGNALRTARRLGLETPRLQALYALTRQADRHNPHRARSEP